MKVSCRVAPAVRDSISLRTRLHAVVGVSAIIRVVDDAVWHHSYVTSQLYALGIYWPRGMPELEAG